MVNPIAIDLFCGAGGLTVGLRQAEFYVVGAVENDARAAATYRLNHPSVRLWEQDIRTLQADEVLSDLNIHRGELDLLAGCPPCQGFTTLRTRNRSRDVHDERNDLIFEFLRLVEGLLPKAVMLENVPNMAQGERIETFLIGLRRLGYVVTPDCLKVLNTADYGVPQRRRRMIMMVSRKGPVPFSAPGERTVTVAHAIGNLPPAGTSGDPLHDLKASRSPKVEAIIRNIPKDGGSRKDLPLSLQLACHQRTDGFRDVYGRMSWGEPAPTITSGCSNPSKGRFLHPEQDRVISLREAALLQTFPADYRFPIMFGKEAIARMIGNALPPEFIKRHAKGIRVTLTKEVKDE